MKTIIISIASQLAKQLAIFTIFNECDIESLHNGLFYYSYNTNTLDTSWQHRGSVMHVVMCIIKIRAVNIIP